MLISHRKWSSIFGRKGLLQKLYVAFEPEGIDGGKGDRFYFEIVIWDKRQRNDWKLTKQMISPWVSQLKKKGFTMWTRLKGSRDLETDPSEYEFSEPPKFISAYSLKQCIGKDKYLLKNATELVDLVFERITKHCEIISSLSRSHDSSGPVNERSSA
jgi:hypothetical protein